MEPATAGDSNTPKGLEHGQSIETRSRIQYPRASILKGTMPKLNPVHPTNVIGVVIISQDHQIFLCVLGVLKHHKYQTSSGRPIGRVAGGMTS